MRFLTASALFLSAYSTDPTTTTEAPRARKDLHVCFTDHHCREGTKCSTITEGAIGICKFSEWDANTVVSKKNEINHLALELTKLPAGGHGLVSRAFAHSDDLAHDLATLCVHGDDCPNMENHPTCCVPFEGKDIGMGHLGQCRNGPHGPIILNKYSQHVEGSVSPLGVGLPGTIEDGGLFRWKNPADLLDTDLFAGAANLKANAIGSKIGAADDILLVKKNVADVKVDTAAATIRSAPTVVSDRPSLVAPLLSMDKLLPSPLLSLPAVAIDDWIDIKKFSLGDKVELKTDLLKDVTNMKSTLALLSLEDLVQIKTFLAGEKLTFKALKFEELVHLKAAIATIGNAEIRDALPAFSIDEWINVKQFALGEKVDFPKLALLPDVANVKSALAPLSIGDLAEIKLWAGAAKLEAPLAFKALKLSDLVHLKSAIAGVKANVVADLVGSKLRAVPTVLPGFSIDQWIAAKQHLLGEKIAVPAAMAGNLASVKQQLAQVSLPDLLEVKSLIATEKLQVGEALATLKFHEILQLKDGLTRGKAAFATAFAQMKQAALPRLSIDQWISQKTQLLQAPALIKDAAVSTAQDTAEAAHTAASPLAAFTLEELTGIKSLIAREKVDAAFSIDDLTLLKNALTQQPSERHNTFPIPSEVQSLIASLVKKSNFLN